MGNCARYVETCARFLFSFGRKCIIYKIDENIRKDRYEGGKTMGYGERIAALEQENRRLREENENLLKIIAQMKVTLNRLIDHFIVEK